MVSTSDKFYKQEFDVIANKLFIWNKEMFAFLMILQDIRTKLSYRYIIMNGIINMIIWHFKLYIHQMMKTRNRKKCRIVILGISLNVM